MKKLLLIAAGLLTIFNLYATSLRSIEYECKIGENTQIIQEYFEVPGDRVGAIWGQPKPTSDDYYDYAYKHARNGCARLKGEFIRFLKINDKPVQIEKKKLL